MRRVLVLGGTGWLGSEVVRSAVIDGAEVVCLARGESGGVPDGARLVRADRRLPGAYESVGGDWDEVVELAYEPELVNSALDHLADRAAHWTLVSTVSVYARNDEPHADESAAVVDPVDVSEYPDAKAAAERASVSRLENRLLVARPGLIVGPGDRSDRFGYWPARLHRGGNVLTPTMARRFVQVIDVADLAAWIVRVGREQTVGTMNAVGDIHPMAEFFTEVVTVTGTSATLIPVDDETLLAHDIRFWAGPRSLPLWVPQSDSGFAQRDRSSYLASGGTSRPLRETITRVLEDEIGRGLDRPRRAGLTREAEAAVLQSV